MGARPIQLTDNAFLMLRKAIEKSITVVNPVSRCPIVVVPANEVERFDREYLSLFAIARQRRRHFMAVKKDLQDAAVEPVFDAAALARTPVGGVLQ